VADGSRTHDLRNHNPNEADSKWLEDKGVTSAALDRCTTGCTSFAELVQIVAEIGAVLNPADLRQLAAMLSAEAERLDVRTT
jgi:hypothetical protein